MKTLLITILISITSNASYIQMLNYSKNSEYKKVLNEAKYSLADYQNPKLHLLWAKSAQKLGKMTIAMGAYERVLILEPKNKEAKKALELIYSQTNREGLSTNPSEGSKKNKVRAQANLSLGHDSNVNANASGDDLDGYYGLDVGVDEVSSSFARVTANISYLYNFEEYDNWFIKSTLDIYYQNNFNAHLYDLTVPTAEIALGYIKGDYLYYLPISYNNINYLNKNLLNIFAFTPRVRVNFLEKGLWDTSLIYAQRNYIETVDIGKDAKTYGFQTGVYWSTTNAQLHLNGKYESRTADKADKADNDRFVDANFFTLDSNLKYYFTSSFIAEAHYLFRYSDYSDDIGTDATPSDISRDDYISEIDLKFSYLLNKDMEIYVRDTYTQSLSTYIPSEYHKNIFLLGFQIRY